MCIRLPNCNCNCNTIHFLRLFVYSAKADAINKIILSLMNKVLTFYLVQLSSSHGPWGRLT